MKITQIKQGITNAQKKLKKKNPLRTPTTYLEAEKDAKKALGAAYKGLFLLGAIASTMFTYTEGKKMLAHFLPNTAATLGAIAFSTFIFYLVDMTLSKSSPLAWMSLLKKDKSTKRGLMLLLLCCCLAFLSMVFSLNGASSPMELAFSYKKGQDVDLVALRQEATTEKEKIKQEYQKLISSAELQDKQSLEALKQDSAKLVSEAVARNKRHNYTSTVANKYLQRAKEDGADKVATYAPTTPSIQERLLNKLDDIDYQFEQHKQELQAQKRSKDADYSTAVEKGSILTEWLGVGSTLLAFIIAGLFVVLQMPVNQAQAHNRAGGKHSVSASNNNASSTQAPRKQKELRSLKNKAYSSLKRIRDMEGDVQTNVQNILTCYENISANFGQDALVAFWNQLASSGTYPVFAPEDLIDLLNA